MITVFPIISRNVNKYKEVYPNLYNDFEVARKKPDYRYQTVTVSEEGQKEYLALVENHLIVKNLPKHNRDVWVTTHHGGRFVGFYEDDQWWYMTASDKPRKIDAHVIQWKAIATPQVKRVV